MVTSLPEERGIEMNALTSVRNAYLELLQSCLTGEVYRDKPDAPFGEKVFDPHTREHGLDWPARAQTMIGAKRMLNLRALMESIIADGVSGDFIETGVWRGGACIFMRALLYAYDVTDRFVWVADSFEGLPPANETKYPADAGSTFHTYPQLAVTCEQVRENFRSYRLLDERVKFLKGWFKDTLPAAPIEKLALLRLDGDMYESTMDALISLYPKLSNQGYIIIDDYHVVSECRLAVSNYCDSMGIKPEIVDIDGVGVYWRKSGPLDNDGKTIPSSPTEESQNKLLLRLDKSYRELSRDVIALLNQDLAVLDSLITQLRKDLASGDARIAQLVKTQDIQVAQLNQILASQEANLHQLNTTLAAREADINRLNNTLATREADNHRLHHTLASREADIHRLNGEILSIYSSASWRWTRPLRAVLVFFKAARTD